VLKPQRERLYRITKKFNHVATGIYPFALEMTDDGERLMEEREFEEIERSLRMELCAGNDATYISLHIFIW